jgi:predicted RNase H-like nuclease
MCAGAFRDILDWWPDAQVIGVDMPIGLVASCGRRCDAAARAYVGARRSSVFAMPPEDVMRAPSYQDALTRTRALGLPGLSKQAWALRTKIAEVAAAKDDRVYEVFPEAAFCTMASAPLAHSKRTWAGLEVRRELLAEHGITLDPVCIGDAGRAAPDDVVDAAAVAWSARRIANGDAVGLPEDAGDGEPRIWY